MNTLLVDQKVFS